MSSIWLPTSPIRYLLLGTSFLFFTALYAQHPDASSIALRHLQQQTLHGQLQVADIQHVRVRDIYASAHNQVTHVYLHQYLGDIPIFNAITGIHILPNGEVAYAQNRFWTDLSRRTTSARITISPVQALTTTAEYLRLPFDPSTIALPRNTNPNQITLTLPNLSRTPIPITHCYLPMPDSTLRLAWQIEIHHLQTDDYTLTFVDVSDGSILQNLNRTIYCQFDDTHHTADARCAHEVYPTPVQPISDDLKDQAIYHVFAFPVESPIHGSRKMVMDPSDPQASPYGWHDINGLPGAETTTTQGNNTFSYLDRNDDDANDGFLPDGGPELLFDFPFSPTIEPEEQPATALTQLFYATNYMHDFAYAYGFDEAAGNFQTNNYGKGGKEKDAVLSQAQDGSGINNANFLTLPDGDPGSMQMYFWTSSGASLLRITAPSSITGNLSTGTASFGPLVTSKPISGQIVAVVDSSGSNNLGCTSIRNVQELKGRIALITRGSCTFKTKVLEAQKAGAIAVIIANVQDETLTMGDDNTSAVPTIPAVLIKRSDADKIRSELSQGRIVQATLAYQGSGPALRDGSLDNGVIAHEYAHGISNRLTGGPSNTDCVFNDEAMGEGWSDFFALATTVQPGQTGREPRGIGNYSARLNADGPGIRRQPYSTDFSINNQVYRDIIGTRPPNATTRAPHPVGEIWAATLWDIYWALSNRYGWDPDPIHGKGGNNLAIQLVIDGLKLQPCSPGFLDARDALLLADQINNGGANQCLLWEAFARRGLGWSADQGSVDDRNDGIQAFNLPPTCLNELSLKKESTPLVEAGQPFDVTLTLTNYKTALQTQLVIQDIIPPKALLIPGSVAGTTQYRVSKDTIWFQLADLKPGEKAVVRYRLQSNPAEVSQRFFFDDMEQGGANWITESVAGDFNWELTTASASNGRLCWEINSSSNRNDHSLQIKKAQLVSGRQPVLRFFHKYQTQTTYDGGIVEISTNQGLSWTPVPDSLFFRRPYVRPLINNTFGNAVLNGFSGQSEVRFLASYINLQPYLGKNILFRFRFASDEDEPGRIRNTLPGWFVDNVELLDMFNYSSNACAWSAEGARACTRNTESGTIAEPALSTSTQTNTNALQGLSIFPNPSSDWVFIQTDHKDSDNQLRRLQLYSADGQLHYTDTIQQGRQHLAVPVHHLPEGVYFLHLIYSNQNLVQKIIVQH